MRAATTRRAARWHDAGCVASPGGTCVHARPAQVLTEYDDADVDLVLEACERMSHHLTAALVTNDISFRHRVLRSTVNGVTYSGARGRTTGTPQSMFFGPAGDPRGAGIATPGAIMNVWSCHREIIDDVLPVPASWALPAAT